MALQDFLADRNLLAIKATPREWGGFFRKAVTIPLHTSGLAIFPDGTRAIFREGQQVSGRFDLVLAKHGEIPLRFVVADLRTSDGLPLSATCGVTASLATGRAEFFGDFCRALFNFPGTYGTGDLERHLAPELRRVLSDYAASRPAADLHRVDHAGPLGEALARALERHLFDAGIVFGRITQLVLESTEFARLRASEERRAEEDRRAFRGMERKEERLRRLAAILKDQDVQEFLVKVPDERLKGLLYAKLMEDDSVPLTAEDLVSKAKDCGEEVVQVIPKAMENLLSSGASVSAGEIESARADRIFVAAGTKVLEFDPASSDPPRAHAFPDPLRSVRYAETSRGGILAGGSKRHVHAILLGERPEVLKFPLPNGRPVRGGVNSIAVSGEHLYATHSEYGLARWRADRPGEPAELLYPEITRASRTTRAVETLGGRLLFASGPHVYLTPPDASGAPLKFVSSIESPVTCVAAAARTVFAGTESGSIVCWKIEAPDQPVVLVRKRDAIVNLRLAKICAIPHLLYSARDLSVRARVIGQNLETSYESGGAPIGVLDAASDLICASDSDGRRVMVWKSSFPARPVSQLDVWKAADKPALDVWIKKVPA